MTGQGIKRAEALGTFKRLMDSAKFLAAIDGQGDRGGELWEEHYQALIQAANEWAQIELEEQKALQGSCLVSGDGRKG